MLDRIKQILTQYFDEHAEAEDRIAVMKWLDDNVRKECGDSFFEQLAKGLRELWPPGEKDGKYPWRDSVSNLTRRLQLLWSIRFPTAKDGTYTLEQCLEVARKYLAQYEDNAKYMQVLKYFILKQKSIVKENGRITYINESKFADMLEGKVEMEQMMDNEWNTILNGVTEEQGELI